MDGTPNKFNVGMGSWDGAESTDLIGLFMLSKIRREIKEANVGKYRDDGLLVAKTTDRGMQQIAVKLHKIYNSVGLSLDINTNRKIVNYLDLSLNLNTGEYSPHMKENNTIRYIDAKSNHAPTILKTIGKNVNDRLTRNSSNKDLFDAAKQPYQEALNKAGHNFQLKFDEELKEQQRQQHRQEQQQQPQQNNNKKKRGRNITWFNCPYSKNVQTPIGKIFLRIIDSCFPPHHKLRKICNRNTLKLSYRTMPNVSQTISRHNKKVLQRWLEEQDPGARTVPYCDCSPANRPYCPRPGQCNTRMRNLKFSKSLMGLN